MTDTQKTIIDYVATHTTPKTDLVPNVIFYSSKVNGKRKAFDTKSILGNFEFSVLYNYEHKDLVDIAYSKGYNNLINAFYIDTELLEEHNIVELSHINCADKSTWDFNRRVFWDLTTNELYNINGELWENWAVNTKGINKSFIDYISGSKAYGIYQNYGSPLQYSKSVCRSIKSILNQPNDTEDSYIQIRELINLYINNCQAKVDAKSKTKTSNMNTIIEMPLTKLGLSKIDDITWQRYGEFRPIVEKVTDKAIVVRIFKRVDFTDYNYKLGRYIVNEEKRDKLYDLNELEDLRFYIFDNGKHKLLTKNYDDTWVTKRITKSLELNIPNSDLLKSLKCMKYKGAILDYLVEKNKLTNKTFNMTMNYPIIEKLFNAGYKNIAYGILNNSYEAKHICKKTQQSYGYDNFGTTIKLYKDKNIKDLLPYNNHQLNYFETYLDKDNYSVITLSQLEKIVGSIEKVKDISNEDFDTITKCNESVHYNWWRIETILSYLDTYADRFNLLKKIRKMQAENTESVELLYDTINLINFNKHSGMEEFLEHNPKASEVISCREVSELMRYHDLALEIQSEIRAERNRLNSLREDEYNREMEKKMVKKQQWREKAFNYKDNDFSIVIPKKLSEVTYEGSYLNHCVGTYKDSVANGNTNILFLRRNNELDKPFYTIEVNNDMKVVQIHGNCNRWLGNNPEAIPFVVKWLKEKNIECEDNKLVNCSLHYSPTDKKLNIKLYR